MSKQELVKREEMSPNEALNFSKMCFKLLNSKEQGQEVVCACCGYSMIVGSKMWTWHNAAIKAWITRRGGSVPRTQAAIKANQTRKAETVAIKPSGLKISKEQFQTKFVQTKDPMKSRNENDLIDRSLLLK